MMWLIRAGSPSHSPSPTPGSSVSAEPANVGGSITWPSAVAKTHDRSVKDCPMPIPNRWTLVWWNRHNRMRLFRSVRPPAAQ